MLPDDVIGDNGVISDQISADETSVDLPVLVDAVSVESEWVVIRYRFDAESRRFYRLNATLMQPHGHRVVTLTNTQLQKAIKEQTPRKE